MNGAFVYILRCADGSFYTGVTRRSVEERVSEHNAGLGGRFTARRRPVVLLRADHHARVDEAVAAERRFKGWSRAKKVAYLHGDYEALHVFARRRSATVPDPSSFDSAAARLAQDEGSGEAG